MSKEDKDTEMIPFEPIFLCFKQNKVMISNAIKKQFPFLEVLRDNNLITEKMYKDFNDSCTNLVPVQKVVYRALDELEKKFNLNVLWVLISLRYLRVYPDLEPILKDFENVLQQFKLWSEEIDRRNPNSQLSLEQEPDDNCSQESLTWSPSGPSSSDAWRSNDGENTTLTQGNQTENHQFSVPQIHNVVVLSENGLSENLNETVEINHVRGNTTGDDTDELQRLQAARPPGPDSKPEESCELKVKLSDRDAGLEPHIPLPCSNESAELPSHELKIRSCFMNLVNIKQENSSVFLSGEHQTHTRTGHNQVSEVIDLTRDNSDDENSPSEESTSVSCQSKPVNSRNPPTSRNIRGRRDTSDTKSSSTRKRQRRTTHITHAEKNSTSRKHGRKIRKKRDKIGKYEIRNIKIPMPTIWKKAGMRRRINSSSQRGRKRGPRVPKQNNVDFSRPELPVTCGSAKGTLNMEKFKKGTHKKSIQGDNEEWFTPREFEIRGNRKRSKNWKKSIRCYGCTLKVLIEKGFLPNPPRTKEKSKYVPKPPRKKGKQCTVCSRGRNLYSCDSCGKFYHKKCHIPPVEDKSGPWSCVFCKIKNQEKCQENQVFHKESEVLKRKMLPEEQLKCELLLLTVYCAPKCCFFIRKPKQSKEEFPDIKEHMWLNKVKDRLNKKAYHSVQHFVKDMRLIFQNHSIFYKNQKFSNLGDTIRKLFEENFKRFFSINETSRQLQPCKRAVLIT